jgi:hypothetical protein
MEHAAIKGDLAIIQKRSSYTGLGYKTVVTWPWILVRVKSVREGRIASFERKNAYGQSTTLVLRKDDRDYGQRLVITQSKVDATACFDALCACEFTDLPAARDAVSHYLLKQAA